MKDKISWILLPLALVFVAGWGFNRWLAYRENAALVRQTYQTFRQDIVTGDWTNAWTLCTAKYRAHDSFTDFTNYYRHLAKDDYELHTNSWVRTSGNKAAIYPLNTKHAWVGPIYFLEYENGKWLFNGEASAFND